MEPSIVIVSRLAIAVGAVSLGLSVSASADTTAYKTKGSVAAASWYQNNDCSFSDFRVEATESVFRSTEAGSVETSMVSVSGSAYDFCSGSPNYGLQIFFAGASDINAPITFASVPLRSATLVAAMPVTEYGSRGVRVVSLTLNVAWEGTDEYIYTGRSTSRAVGGGAIVLTRNTGTHRSAAASGTAELDGVAMTNGIATAELIETKDGTITVIKP